jgi:hypothetical protein
MKNDSEKAIRSGVGLLQNISFLPKGRVSNGSEPWSNRPLGGQLDHPRLGRTGAQMIRGGDLVPWTFGSCSFQTGTGNPG